MKKTVITLTDDLVQHTLGLEEAADETVTFSIDGTNYEIDLKHSNAEVLRAWLAPYRKAGRPTNKAASIKPRPMVTDAGAGATLNRHQGGVDPAAARAWATEQGLIKPGQRGRLSKDIKEAYTAFTKFGDRKLLDELLQEVTTAPLAEAVEQGDHSEAAAAVTRALAKDEPKAETVDPDEAEARKHYREITLSPRASNDPNYWARRTAGGLDRTDKVALMKLGERIDILTDRNLTILGKLAGIIPLDKGNKVSYLAGSETRLENLEMIEHDPKSPHGWSITDFGRYAHQARSLGE
ncbi:histone-like nucleoid-structuring protein Lsr2 [Streptomyces sp. NBC_01456]|uniref:histone-like nucleoid-structuring protein Lsr2 n=1 Tax=Streptomyces sp. NBC_01456 TaxID=2975868 RepID=UPI003FCCAE32